MNVNEPAYWRDRLDRCGGDLQRAMFEGSTDAFGARHAEQMRRVQAGVRPTDRVLDVGCGYGRLLTMLPSDWRGEYRGVDVSPDFVRLAKILYPARDFVVGDFSKVVVCENRFDVAVSVWVRTMMYEAELGATWELIEDNMRRCADRLLVID